MASSDEEFDVSEHSDDDDVMDWIRRSRSPSPNSSGDEKSSDSDEDIKDADEKKILSLTENGSLTYATTRNRCLDFYFDVMQNTYKTIIRKNLRKAWKEDSLLTLKLVFQLRDIRNGKGAIKEFHICLIWMLKHHPQTLIHNLQYVAQHGYWKDLSWFVQFLMTGKIQMTTRPPRPKKSLKERQATKEMARRCSRRRGIQASRTDPVIDVNEPLEDVMRRRVKGEINSRQWKKYHSSQTAVTKEEAKKSFQTVAQQIHKEVSIQAKSKRKVIKAETLSKLTELKTTNPNFNAVYEKVVDLFATALKNDKELLGKDGRLPATNLVGKWAPTIDCAIDKHTRLARNIAAALYPASEHQKENESEDMFRQRVYTNYRKEYLNPLRQNIDVPERKMSRNKWSEINYPRVPSVSMKRSKEVFLKRDAERFQSFLGEVKAGTKKMASGALMPHEIVRDLRRSSGEKKELEEVAELQWNSYVDKLKQVGIFNSALAVADVSGSMEGDPMEVSIALSLLTAALSKPPFNGVICTFSESPQLQVVNQPTLKEKIQFTANMDWGGSTNFQGIFNLLLELAKKTNMPADEMVKTIFVFSDMEFNIAGGEEYETDYKLIERKFQEAGYPLPSIVFWNLRGGRRSKPVTATQSNVALVSGFSGQMMKSFLESGDFENPLVSMLKSLGSHYDHLKVVD